MDGPQIQYNNSVCVLAHSMTPGCPPDCPGTFLGSGLDLGGDPLRSWNSFKFLFCYETKWANEVNNFFNSSGFIFRSPQTSTVGDSGITLAENPGKTGSCLSLAPGELVAESLALCRRLRVLECRGSSWNPSMTLWWHQPSFMVWSVGAAVSPLDTGRNWTGCILGWPLDRLKEEIL